MAPPSISGFTFCRNAVVFDYPIVESIRSILPIVNEYVVNVGRSEDQTLDLIRSVRDPKIRIFETEWDETLRRDGLIFSQQTNLALAQCKGDWAFYLQADEVVHEDDLGKVLKSLEHVHPRRDVLGLLFRYLHFKGDYRSIDPWSYHWEVRLVRNDGRLRSIGDACGFGPVDDPSARNLKDGPRRRLGRSGARIFHYGHVKDPAVLVRKKRYQASRQVVPESERRMLDREAWEFETYDILREFRGTHPAVMVGRVSRSTRLRPRRNRWLNWRFYREVFAHGFKG
ncbi:MAG: glycosyltransferase [candidate division NC10 bacterium]|nr:glycosyltransferase [candidate division NC10 bacterium]